MKTWWDALQSQIMNASSVAILTHKDPDGDGLAAAVMMKKYFLLKGIMADVVLEEPCPSLYSFLDAGDLTISFKPDLQYDFIFILDCHELSRLGICAPLTEKAKTIFALDHHEKREIVPRANALIDSSAVSVGCLLHQFMYSEVKQFNEEFQAYYAKAIYTTILNDTDNFVNANTDVSAFQISADLMEFGLKPYQVAHDFLFNKPANEMRFVGEVLATIETFHDGSILFMHSTLDMLARNNLDQSATTKLTRWVKGIAGVEVVIYFREIKENDYRLSLRSTHVAVNKVAELYGGGGHILAAGCSFIGTLAEVKKQMLEHFSNI
ncbi:MAG TPA: DHH family phosphoesterase [Candidatus Cloacimonadota bacterium]|nr:DHH family phosphoesterase [Candidatus Cloacimonadota bacterium]HPT72762.1 DHH family phosphoesterase [Candidatus Cloacimonadota bacterium]